MRTRTDTPSSARENGITSRNRNAPKDLMYDLLQKQKREKKKQNNNNWSDDENDNRATCKSFLQNYLIILIKDYA